MSQFDGKSVLVVEDEALIAMLLEAMLDDNGIVMVGPAATLGDALDLVEAGGFDAALLDLNLEDGLSYPVAERLRAAGIPFAITSGSSEIDTALGDVRLLTKPFMQNEVEAVLRELLG